MDLSKITKGEVSDSVTRSIEGKYGELFWLPNGQIVYSEVPELALKLKPNELAIDQFTYTVTDTHGATCEAIIDVYLMGENDPVVAANDTVSIDEDSYIQHIHVLNNDTDPDNNIDSTSLRIVSAPRNGKAAVNTYQGTVSYIPNPNFFGTDSLQYQICDEGMPVYCDAAWIFIEVKPVNDPPIAKRLVLKMNRNETIAFDAWAQVEDMDDGIDQTSLVLTKVPQNGTADPNVAQGVITYEPATDFTGVDELVYALADNSGEKAHVVVTLLVVPDASMTFAQDDFTFTDEDKATNVYILQNDTVNGVQPDRLSVDIRVHPENGSAEYDLYEGYVRYTPNPDFNGTDSFVYTVCGNNGVCDMAVATVEVRPINDPIVARDDYAEMEAGIPFIWIPVLDNDFDLETKPQPSTLTVNISVPGATVKADKLSGLVKFTPPNGFTGMVVFTYEVYDEKDGVANRTYDDATVTVWVKPLINYITARPDYYEVNENQSKVLINPHPADNDTASEGYSVDPTSLTISNIIQKPEHGTLAFNQAGQPVYTPDPNYFGPDFIRYRITSQAPGTYFDISDINIWVKDVNTPPVANPDEYVVAQNLVRRLQVLANDIDVDGTLNFSSLKVVTPANQIQGEVQVDATTGDLLYTPKTNTSIDEFLYEICDNKGACDTAKVTIMINLGSLVPGKQVTYEDTPDTLDMIPLLQIYNLAENISSYKVKAEPTNGSIQVVSGITEVIYSPKPDFFGDDYYNIILYYANNDSADLRVTVWVDPVNDAPVANPDTLTWASDTYEFTFDYRWLKDNDTDVDHPVDSLQVLPVVLNHAPEFTLTFNADSTLTLRADTILWCNAWFEYQVTDPEDSTDVGIVTLIPVLKGIEAIADRDTVQENTSKEIDVLANDLYVDGQRCTVDSIQVVNGPFKGTASVTSGLNVHYTPEPEYWGRDSLQYALIDRWGQTDTAWVYIEIDQDNLPPIAVADTWPAEFGTPTLVDVLANDSDPDGFVDSIRTYVSTPPQNGIAYFDTESLKMIYTPDLGNCEGDQFTYTIFDNEGDSATAVVSITMKNDAPIYPVADTVSTYPGLSVQVLPLANDSGYFAPFIYEYTTPSNGYVTQTGDDVLTYTPEGGFVGRDSIIYQIQSVCGNTQGAYILFLVEKLRVPEIITPNGDGKNDVLIIDGIEFFPDAVLTITNRMGHIVYRAQGYNNDWSGFSNRGSLFADETLPSGTYFYTLTYNNENNRQAGIIYIFR